MVERGDGLLPWNGDHDNKIDRFDARSLLDFYRDPVPGAQRPKTPGEEKLQEVNGSLLVAQKLGCSDHSFVSLPTRAAMSLPARSAFCSVPGLP
jgi:hypothetical protein